MDKQYTTVEDISSFENENKQDGILTIYQSDDEELSDFSVIDNSKITGQQNAVISDDELKDFVIVDDVKENDWIKESTNNEERDGIPIMKHVKENEWIRDSNNEGEDSIPIMEHVKENEWIKDSNNERGGIIPMASIKFVEENKEKKKKIFKVERMQTVIGLLCMSFKNVLENGPYEFTLATMSHYISGECDAGGHWLKNLQSYLEQLDITQLYVLGSSHKFLIQKFVLNIPIYRLKPCHLPLKQHCPNCLRFGCSKFKCQSILRYNYWYPIQIPCSR